jgi:hypothetical protein
VCSFDNKNAIFDRNSPIFGTEDFFVTKKGTKTTSHFENFWRFSQKRLLFLPRLCKFLEENKMRLVHPGESVPIPGLPMPAFQALMKNHYTKQHYSAFAASECLN